MDPVELYKLLARVPFQPVRVVLKDGRSFPIPTRRFAIVGVDYLDVGFQALGHEEGIWGDYEHLQLKDVLRVEPLVAPPNAAAG
jgi:hypothetical protein